jgi:hypothetical protein
MLYQLSYLGIKLAHQAGFEPAFSAPFTITEVEALLGYWCINLAKSAFLVYLKTYRTEA